MYTVVWAAIAATCSAKYDSNYAHESFGRTFSPIREYGGDCSRYCLDKRPHGGELWQKGDYSCGECKGNVGGNIWRCSCDLCQRDCSFSELYDPRGCDLKPIAARKLSGIGKALEVLGTIFKGAGNIVSNIPHPAGAWAGPVIGFIGDMFHVGTFVEKNKVIDGIQDDINRRTDELIGCFDQRVIQFEPKMYDFSMKEAISSYQIALNTDATDSDVKESVTSDAWASHIKVIDSKFKGRATDDEPLFLYTMFMSGVVNDFASTFVLISIDYLKFLKMSESPDFDMVYDKTMDGMETLLAYGKDAKWRVAEEWTKDLHAMPCRNGKSLDDELKAWQDSFNGEYLEPIEKFLESIEQIFVTGMPGIEEGAAGFDESAPLKSAAEIVGYCNWNNCNGVVEGGDFCNQGKDACISCGSGSQWCDGPAIACADNYLPQDGDVGGWGVVAGAGGGQYVANCDECARWCTDRSACKSYECGGDLTELRCNLNEEANPTLQQYKNYAFCTKMSGTPALIKQLMG